LVSDGQYGDYVRYTRAYKLKNFKIIFFSFLQITINKDPKRGWTGLIGEVLDDKADIILAPFNINPDRLRVLDFTNPYKYLGIRILVKRVIFKVL
jgi:ABC-type amino acid transport substrate-binding protein